MTLVKIINESIRNKKKLIKLEKKIIESIGLISSTLKKGKKILICGNGGSAADAQHLAAEFLIRLTSDVNRESIPALSLAQDTSTLTACINDYGPDEVFKRVFSALSAKGDILLVITTSGNSKNILEVLKTAKKKNIYSIGFYGNGGGLAKKITNLNLIIKSKNTARIQETHILMGHYIFYEVEKRILKIL